MRTTGILLIYLLLLSSLSSPACLWVKGTTKEGSRKMTSGPVAAVHLRSLLRRSIETDLRVRGESMEILLRNAASFDDRNDYAVALLYLGRSPEAVARLEKLEAERPGDYAVAANLGTALELSGRTAEAQKWIAEAIRRNPDSHHGTEWLHLKILDAKLAHESDPAYFDEHSVLNLDYRALETGAKSISLAGETRLLHEVYDALRYQLSERLQFVKKADEAVASLLFDFALIEAGTGTLESAIGLLQLAAEYGYPAARIDPLLARYASTIRFARAKTYFYIGGAFAGLVALLAYSIRRRRRSQAA